LVVDQDLVFDVAFARRALAKGGRIADVTPGEGPGDGLRLPAGTAAERVAARRALFRSLTKPSDGPVSRLLNRPMSLSVTRLLLDTSVTPNQMTIVSTVIGAIGVYLVFLGGWGAVAAGAGLVHLQSVLDGTDGEIARLKFQTSRFGEWLDNVLDDQLNATYALALGFAASAASGRPLWRWLAIASLVAITVYNVVLYHQLAVVHGSGNPFHFRWWFQKDGADLTTTFARPTPAMRVAAFFRALVRRDVFLLAFFGLALVDLVPVAVIWYAILAFGHFLMTLAHLANGGMPRPAPRSAP